MGPMPDYLLLLHGAGSTADFMVRRFPAEIFGLSCALAPQQRVPEVGHLAHLHRLIARLGTPQAICGVSMGAHLAAALASELPIEDVCLVLPAALADPGQVVPAAVQPISPQKVARRRAALAQVPADWVADELLRAWHQLGDEATAASLTHGAASPGPAPARLAAIRARVRIVAFDDDPVHPLSVAQSWAMHIAGARVQVLSRSSLDRDPLALARACAAWD